MSNGLDIPTYIGKATPEQIMKLDLREAQDKAYTLTREQNIIKKLNKLNSSLRKTHDYINEHYREEISLEEMSEEIGFSISTLKINIADLNFWHEFGYRMKRIKGRKNWIKSIKKDLEDTEKYLRQKARTIASMDQVYGNMSDDIELKQKEKIKKKIKVAVKNEN